MQMQVSTFFDIAGRVSRSSFGADRVTVAGVCLSAESIVDLKCHMPVSLHKWRDANDDDVKFVVDLLIGNALAVSAFAIDKSVSAWTNFWRESQDVNQITSSLSGKSMSFVKAAAIIKFWLFGQSSALTTSIAINHQRNQLGLNSDDILRVAERLVFDKEVDGVDNIEMFMDMWQVRNSHQPLTRLMSVEWEVLSTQLLTEQSEPLLLLPDYVAGIAHAVHSSVDTITASEVSQVAVLDAHERLLASSTYVEKVGVFDLNYFDIFPEFRQFEIPTHASDP